MLRILAKNLPRGSQFRLASSLSKVELCNDDDIPESPTLTLMKKCIKERRSSRRVYALKLKQKLQCSQETIHSMDLTPFTKMLVTQVTERLQYLNDIGDSRDTIAENIAVLFKPIEQLRTEVAIIESLEPRCINDLLPLLTLTGKEWDQTIARIRLDGVDNNRIYCMSELLDAEPAHMAKLYAAHNKLLNRNPVERLRERIQIMLLHGVKVEKLRRNLSVLTRSTGRIERRLTRVRQVYGGELQPWMVHCLNSRIERHLETKVGKYSCLNPNETVPEFLARKLRVEPKFIDALLLKRPQIPTINLNKLSDIFDFLLDECHFTAHQIISCPHIIFFKLNTTKRRFVECRDVYNYTPANLSVFAKSETEYRKHIALMLRRRQCLEQADR